MQTQKYHYKPSFHTEPKLIFVMGNFYNREELRKGLVSPVDRPSFEEAPYISRKEWTDATFATYQNPEEPNPIRRVEPEGNIFYYFRARENKILLLTHELQDEIRKTERPVCDHYGELPVSKFGGIIPYNHRLVREVMEMWDHSPKVLSIVVSEKPPENLEASVNAEFAEGADVFLTGQRDPQEYLKLIRAWSGGNINPRNYKEALFNLERFETNRSHLLVPTHNYN